MLTNRRAFIGALASGAVLTTAANAKDISNHVDPGTLRKDADAACVYHCDFGDPERFSRMMQNMLTHYCAYDFNPMAVKLTVVAHGPGVKFFLADRTRTPWETEEVDPALYQRFTGLAGYGMEAYLCSNTFKTLHIDPAKTYRGAFLKFVPVGIAAVASLQAKGFSYVKVG